MKVPYHIATPDGSRAVEVEIEQAPSPFNPAYVQITLPAECDGRLIMPKLWFDGAFLRDIGVKH